jgi:hypothetical protein
MKLPLTGGSYEGRSTNIAPEICLNWFFEETVGGESLVSTPGATVFSSPAVGEVRGGIEYNGLAYFVVGNTTGRVTMAHNGARAGGNQQIFIADGSPNGYVYDNTTSTLTANSKVIYLDEDGNTLAVDVNPETVVFVDGYFAFQVKNTDRFFC